MIDSLMDNSKMENHMDIQGEFIKMVTITTENGLIVTILDTGNDKIRKYSINLNPEAFNFNKQKFY